MFDYVNSSAENEKFAFSYAAAVNYQPKSARK